MGSFCQEVFSSFFEFFRRFAPLRPSQKAFIGKLAYITTSRSICQALFTNSRRFFWWLSITDICPPPPSVFRRRHRIPGFQRVYTSRQPGGKEETAGGDIICAHHRIDAHLRRGGYYAARKVMIFEWVVEWYPGWCGFAHPGS